LSKPTGVPLKCSQDELSKYDTYERPCIQLREFVLNVALHLPGVIGVCAVTRTRGFRSRQRVTGVEYNEYVLQNNGKAVQLDRIKPKLKPPGTKRLKLKCDELHSSFAFKFNLRRYTTGGTTADCCSTRGAAPTWSDRCRTGARRTMRMTARARSSITTSARSGRRAGRRGNARSAATLAGAYTRSLVSST
jgi:hypothetical protein